MTSLADVALAFCRECLGWAAADDKHSSDSVIWNGQFKEHFAGFRYTDLNSVMATAREWCRRNNLRFTIGCDESGFEVAVFSPSFDEIDEEAISDNLCHALLAACVEASRKLKGAARARN